MKAIVVSPAAINSTSGNNVTATRWAGILRKLGHDAEIVLEWNGEDCDVLIALHARRSHSSIAAFHRANPAKPLVVALTGTDLYRDLPQNVEAQGSLHLATQVVVLQSAALDNLSSVMRAKATVIYQSAEASAAPPRRSDRHFQVCVLSHLRDVKDPLRPALAARSLPPQSTIRIVHAGRALNSEWENLATLEQSQNARYSWIGDVEHASALALLASSDLYVLPSVMEGGANTIAEAIVYGVPIICSDIPGNIGMLGADYPGYFRLYDVNDLARLLLKAETERDYLSQLRQRVGELQPRFSPQQEATSWRRLLTTIEL